ncbi:secondary thiamine-phosphate synthase enzyme YjbQ [Bradyrhizobium liaoningense]|uniref:secondary thiamine-phosphate synthase enzyme YjbQ n=1 Tax=Bradyrhizobium liaoningense TaxID=43992 RepID=UPI001BAB9B24|nr:secondary thiamine-phosphate synthase enzyme YjbQ [Bradyrhizobium liaoningense]MBR0858454.1 YjbQ family protein [Bradyrhizobium liaoningense]
MTSSKSVTRSAPSTVHATSISTATLTVQTSGSGFIDLTREAATFITDVHARDGALTLFIRHTSASLTIQENADPSVLVDLTTVLARLAPDDADAGWTHDTEGPDDMPAHIKTMLTGTSLHVPVLNGKLALGTWQAIYLIEHRARPHRREVVLQFIGGNQ